jgi:hypothetical protein
MIVSGCTDQLAWPGSLRTQAGSDGSKLAKTTARASRYELGATSGQGLGGRRFPLTRHANCAQSARPPPSPVTLPPRPAGHRRFTVPGFSAVSCRGSTGIGLGPGSRRGHAHFAAPCQGMRHQRVSVRVTRGWGRGGCRFLNHSPNHSSCFAGKSAAILCRASSQTAKEVPAVGRAPDAATHTALPWSGVSVTRVSASEAAACRA